MPRRDDLVYRATLLAERMYGRTTMKDDGGSLLLLNLRVSLRVAIHSWSSPQRVAATVLGTTLEVAALRNGPAALAAAKTRIRSRMGIQVANMVEGLSAPSAIDPIPGETQVEREVRDHAYYADRPSWIQRVVMMREMDGLRAMAPAADADSRLAMSASLARFREAVSGTLADSDLASDAGDAIDEVATAAQAELDEIATDEIAAMEEEADR